MERREILHPLYRERLLHERAKKANASIVKRLLDIVLSLLFLLLLSPLLLVTIILIKATSKGPVFFVHERVGLNYRYFPFIKFRSMRQNADQAVHKKYAEALIKGLKSSTEVGKGVTAYKMMTDSRMTPIGKFIRKLSIDEIPQFINVLKGEMSIVGPRPPIPYELEFYTRRAKNRFLVKPGITGLWQVNGRSTTTFERMIALDLCYITHWSIWLDIAIILRTFIAVFDTSKAY